MMAAPSHSRGDPPERLERLTHLELTLGRFQMGQSCAFIFQSETHLIQIVVYLSPANLETPTALQLREHMLSGVCFFRHRRTHGEPTKQSPSDCAIIFNWDLVRHFHFRPNFVKLSIESSLQEDRVRCHAISPSDAVEKAMPYLRVLFRHVPRGQHCSS